MTLGPLVSYARETGYEQRTVYSIAYAHYAHSRLKWVNNKESLRFIYESTGEATCFTEGLYRAPLRSFDRESHPGLPGRAHREKTG